MDGSPLLPDKKFSIFEATVVGNLSEEDRVQLEHALRSSSQTRAEFRNYVALHVELAGAVRLARARQVIFDEIRQRAASSAVSKGASSQPATGSTPPSSLPSSPLKRGWVWSIGIAAALAASICLPFLLAPLSDDTELVGDVVLLDALATKPPAPVATLASQENAEWEDLQITTGQALREGDTIKLRRGNARISVGVGAEIAMEGPCELLFVARDRVQLKVGDVAVHVAEWAKGFTILTDSMEVVDLGTTFTVSASGNEKDEAHVIKGLVRVHPRVPENIERRGLLVSEGEALTVDGRGMHMNQKGDPLRNINLQDIAVVRPYRPIVVHNTGVGIEVGDEDPYWRVIAGPEGSFDGPEYASVCTPDKRYLVNDPSTSQWVSIEKWKTAAADSVYTYQTSFDLTGYELTTIQLFGRFLADNGIQEVRVNGKSVKIESWSDNVRGQSFGNPEFRFVNVTDGLMQGRNTVEIDVYNGMHISKGRKKSSIPNPVALRVEWYSFGRQLESAGD